MPDQSVARPLAQRDQIVIFVALIDDPTRVNRQKQLAYPHLGV